MIALALLLQVSSLVRPLYLEEKPPELRSARAIVVQAKHDGVERTQDAMAERARAARAKLEAGVPFDAVSSELSDAPNARQGGVLGTFGPGMLPAKLDAFLFAAAPNALSEPLEVNAAGATGDALYVVQRIDTQAAALELRIACTDATAQIARERIDRLHAQLAAGADFAALARASSDDKESAERGGQLSIFERGPQDTLLKAAAFQLDVGQVSAPIRSPLGWHLIKRVELSAVDPSLAENHWIRVRTLLVRHALAQGAKEDGTSLRSAPEAKAFAEELLARIQKGESFAELARAHDEDRGGRERSGDLGWIHRATPDLATPVRSAFLLRAGQIELRDTPLGFLLLKRER